MKKSFIYTMLLTVGVMLGITACSSDNNWQPGSVSGQQVFFSNNLGSSYEISPTENSFSVQVSRYDKSGALNVPLTVTMNEGSIFNVPTSVSFADGQDVANLVISYNPADIVYGKYDTITVVLNDAAVIRFGTLTSMRAPLLLVAIKWLPHIVQTMASVSLNCGTTRKRFSDIGKTLVIAT